MHRLMHSGYIHTYVCTYIDTCLSTNMYGFSISAFQEFVYFQNFQISEISTFPDIQKFPHGDIEKYRNSGNTEIEKF